MENAHCCRLTARSVAAGHQLRGASAMTQRRIGRANGPRNAFAAIPFSN
ncbi:hypothetical protein [Methylibium sp.]